MAKTQIISHPKLIKAILERLKELGITYDKSRISSVSTKTKNVLVYFTSDNSKKLYSIRIHDTLQGITSKNINEICNKIIEELDEETLANIKI